MNRLRSHSDRSERGHQKLDDVFTIGVLDPKRAKLRYDAGRLPTGDPCTSTFDLGMDAVLHQPDDLRPQSLDVFESRIRVTAEQTQRTTQPIERRARILRTALNRLA
ncbi:MAG: hypothetical protein OEW91_10465, partial [Acidimicrobiia bacterium]|nr:hypothetical protein [Acidimicrobiia bacterium]